MVVYTSMDQNYSEPILKAFEAKAGIRVLTVYDTEATKTTGLANRVLAEKDHPQADVFWNSEIGRTVLLMKQGVFQPYASPNAKDIPAAFKDPQERWTGFAARARILVYNKSLVKEAEAPSSIFELTDPKWKGRVGMAYPLFGTTAIQCAALTAALGGERANAYFQKLKENGLVIVDGNAAAMARVIRGDLAVAFTDTDDAYASLGRNADIGIVFPDQNGIGTLLIINSVGMIQKCPHPKEARALIDYLVSREVEKRLALSEARMFPVRSGIKTAEGVPSIDTIKFMAVEYERVVDAIPSTTEALKAIFVR